MQCFPPSYTSAYRLISRISELSNRQFYYQLHATTVKTACLVQIDVSIIWIFWHNSKKGQKLTVTCDVGFAKSPRNLFIIIKRRYNGVKIVWTSSSLANKCLWIWELPHAPLQCKCNVSKISHTVTQWKFWKLPRVSFQNRICNFCNPTLTA